MQSARDHPAVAEEYLEKEIARGRMLGPFPDTQSLPPLYINRFGVIPKGHNTGKWRLITDLSHPRGQSVNDGIDPELCSMSYMTVEEVAALVSRLGKGTLLAKIESAYQLIPVHPQDRPLQAMEWKGKIYIDPMPPFGDGHFFYKVADDSLASKAVTVLKKKLEKLSCCAWHRKTSKP